MSADINNERPDPDDVLVAIADFVTDGRHPSAEAIDTARLVLLDSVACGLMALGHETCRRLLGPVVEGTTVPHGARVPGTAYRLDPVTAAFDIGTCIRWLDFNDTWLAAEWGHPSDNLGAILAVTDYLSRRRAAEKQPPFRVADVLMAAVQAHEIQGVLALAHSFNAVGLDHVLLVRLASAAVATNLLGGTSSQVRDACSQAILDGGSLRTYRHAPNTGSRKSWAAGDATSRGVRLALMTMAGEPGYATPLSAPNWGFNDVLFDHKVIGLPQPLGCYVMENVLLKVAFPAEFHGQTAAEAAITLHPLVRAKLDEIDRVVIRTQRPAMRIIDKQGPLHNPPDRDHCLQYIVAVCLIYGELTAQHYEDATAADPRIDHLRERMVVTEDPQFTGEYLEPSARSIANAVQVFFADGTCTPDITIRYPLGHRRRRNEALPQLNSKYEQAVRAHYPPEQAETILESTSDPAELDTMAIDELLDLLAEPS